MKLPAVVMPCVATLPRVLCQPGSLGLSPAVALCEAAVNIQCSGPEGGRPVVGLCFPTCRADLEGFS
jgi:hypothetical protein